MNLKATKRRLPLLGLLLSLLISAALPAHLAMAAATLKQRGLGTQSYGVQDNATPGDLVSIDSGSFTRRPYGPSLAGWPMGFSAHNSSANARHLFTNAGGSTEETCGEYWEFYKFGPGNLNGANGRVEIARVRSPLGGNENFGYRIHVGTMALHIDSINGRFAAVNNVATVPRHKWVAFGVGYERIQAFNGTDSKWTLKFMYREAGAATVTLATLNNVDYSVFVMNGASGGTLWENGSTISARVGLPSIYSMASIADMAFPADLTMPTDTPGVWYVSSSATGGGDGTSLATAWTPAEQVAEMGSGKYTVTSGALLDTTNGNAVVDSTATDADVLKQRMKSGRYAVGGDRVYYDDGGGPLRYTSQLVFSTCPGTVHESPSSRMPDLRNTSRVTGWVLHAGNVWKKSFTSKFPVVFEFDSALEADSFTGKPRWLAHPTAANLAAYLAAATAGSFWSDGTTVYLWPTGSGDPNTNGKAYEVSVNDDFTDFFSVQTQDVVIRNLSLRLCAAVSNDNSASSNATGRNLFLGCTGMQYSENLLLLYGGKHNYALGPAGGQAVRAILIDSTLNDARPGPYGGIFGGQTLLVQNGATDGIDQFYYQNIVCTTNAGQVGSTQGIVDATQPTITEHNGGDAAYPFLKGWLISCRLPGLMDVGSTTTTLVVDRCTLGTLGVDGISLAAKNNNVSATKILCRSMPFIGNGAVPSAGTHLIHNNLIIASGATGANATIIGNARFRGNTIDALALSGGTTKALWTRGGVVAAVFTGNIIRFNNGDGYRLLDTITPGSGDSLAMGQNLFEGNDANRILVSSYGGATKTLTQLQAGQDISSSWTVDVKLSALYQPLINSQARRFLGYDIEPALAGTLDFYGHKRGELNNAIAPTSGNTDAGAVLYREAHQERHFERGESP